MLTNSIDNAWWKNDDVTPMFDGDGCRSTSVGDQVLVGNTKYECSDLWLEIIMIKMSMILPDAFADKIHDLHAIGNFNWFFASSSVLVVGYQQII